MSWAENAIALLKKDGYATIYPKGNSMLPLVKSGQRVNLSFVDINSLHKDDIVLCKVQGHVYLHLVKAISTGKVLIGNNKGRINGWTKTVYGKMIR